MSTQKEPQLKEPGISTPDLQVGLEGAIHWLQSEVGPACSGEVADIQRRPPVKHRDPLKGPQGLDKVSLRLLPNIDLDNYQYHVEIHLRHMILRPYCGYGSMILAVVEAPTVGCWTMQVSKCKAPGQGCYGLPFFKGHSEP